MPTFLKLCEKLHVYIVLNILFFLFFCFIMKEKKGVKMFYLFVDELLYGRIFEDFKSAYSCYRYCYFPLDYRIYDENNNLIACKVNDYAKYKKEILKNE